MSGERSSDSSTFVTSLDGLGASDAPAPAPAGPAPTPSVAARYARGEEVARGGLGLVRRGTDLALDREVALKELLQPSVASVARFDRETRLTARLQHPNIVPVYDGGRDPEGRPFLAMRFVRGQSLAEAIAARPTLAERMRLLPHVIDACNAVAYAHGQRVAHRDLKPDNILVGDFGETVVIDWGLAKDLDADVTEELGEEGPVGRSSASGRSLTRVGTVMGTPAYMPPEQAAGRRVDERADVYALGAVLYHALAGVRPYADAEDTLLAVGVGPPKPLVELAPDVPRDLLAVTAKAMARDPADRYADARSLAAELEAFQAGAFVSAHRYTAGERIRRAIRQNPVSAALVALLAVGSVAGVGALWRAGVVAEGRRAEAELARQEAELLLDALTVEQARLMLDVDPGRSLGLLDGLSASWPFDGRVRALAAQAYAEDPPIHALDTREDGSAAGVEWSADGLVLCRTDEVVRLGEDHSVVERRAVPAIRACEVHPDGGLVVGAAEGVSWVGPRGTVGPLPVDGGVSVARAAAGGRFAWGTDASQVGVHTPAGDWTWRAPTFVHDVAFGRDGALLAVSGDSIELADPGQRRVLDRAPLGMDAYGMFASPWRDEVVVVGDSGTVQLATWTGGSLALTPLATPGSWYDEAVWLAEDVLAIAGAEDAVRVLDVRTGATRVLASTEGAPEALVLGPDGRLAIGTETGAVSVVEWPSARVSRLSGGGEPTPDLAWSPDGRNLAVSRRSGVVIRAPGARDGQVVHRADGVVTGVAAGPGGAVAFVTDVEGFVRSGSGAPVALGAGGKSIAWCGGAWWVGSPGAVRRFEASGAPSRVVPTPGDARRLECAPDGSALALDLVNVGSMVLDPASGALGPLRGGERSFLNPARFAPDGRLLLVGGSRVAEIPAGASEADAGTDVTPPDVDTPMALAWWRGEPVTATFQGHIWRGRGAAATRLAPQMGLPTAMDVVADSLVVADSAGVVWRWEDPARPARPALIHRQYVHAMAAHPGGRFVATAGWDDLVVIWDAQHPELPGRPLRGHTDAVMTLAWSQDGRTLYAGDRAGEVRAWTDPLATEPDALRRQVRALAEALEARRPLPTPAELDALR